MCGRYTMFLKPEQIKSRFKAHLNDENLSKLTKPRYNVAPSQDVPVITSALPRECTFMRWGLIPSWAKDAAIGNKLINAREETLVEKPSFASAFQQRRCLVLANGFYEWQKIGSKTKQPMYVQLRSGEPFALAGLWESWKHPTTQELVRSCTIITTEPNALIAPLHHRMAVILREEEESQWLDESRSTHDVMPLLRPYSAAAMEVYPVSTRINAATLDNSSLIDRLEPDDFGTGMLF